MRIGNPHYRVRQWLQGPNANYESAFGAVRLQCTSLGTQSTITSTGCRKQGSQAQRPTRGGC